MFNRKRISEVVKNRSSEGAKERRSETSVRHTYNSEMALPFSELKIKCISKENTLACATVTQMV